MTKIHPSRWTIRHESNKKFCQVLDLPLGKDTRSIKISTKLFNKIYNEWDGQAKTQYAGDFATALRELANLKVDLRKIPQVNGPMVDLCYVWLEEYNAKVAQFGVQIKEDVKKEHRKQTTVTVEPEFHEKVLLAAITGFCAHGGLAVDPVLLYSQARHLADVATVRE